MPYLVRFEIETPEKFTRGTVISISNLVRWIGATEYDMSGNYTIYSRALAQDVFYGGSGGAEGSDPGLGWVHQPATLTIEVDLADDARWLAFTSTAALVAPGAPAVHMEVYVPGAGPVFVGDVTESCQLYINAPDLFGGTAAEGGVQGYADIMMGEPTQLPSAALQSMVGQTSGFRRMFTIFFNGLVCAMNPYPKPWLFRVRRALKGWDGEPFYAAKAVITLSRALLQSEDAATNVIKAMNPAHIIYECLTNREWGRGLPRAALDDVSFTAAADALYDEGFGLCMKWGRTDSIESFVQLVLDHIGATLFTDRETALLKLKLIRGDYNIDDLPIYESSTGLMDITDAAVAATPTYINEIKVTFTDPISSQELTVKVQNLANIKASGGQINSMSKSYLGIPTSVLALRVAQRDLRAAGLELRKFTLTLDRRGWKTTPGDAICVRDVKRNIQRMAVRVGHVEEGNNADGKITVTVVQDVFTLPSQTFVANQSGSGVGVTRQQACVGQHKVFEMPYALLVRDVSAADFAYIDDADAFLAVVADRSVITNSNYKIAVRDSAPTLDDVPATSAAYCGYTP